MMRRIDLLPGSYAEIRQARRNVLLAGALGAVLLALLVGWFFLLGSQIASEEQDLADAEARADQVRRSIAELQQFADLDAEVKAKRQALQTTMAGDLDWPSLLTDIATVIPPDVWLTNATSSAGATVGAAPVGTEGATIRISNKAPVGRIGFTGRALSLPDVARWLVRLGSVQEFSAVWLNTATVGAATEGTGVEGAAVDFDSTLELNDGALSGRFQDVNP